MTKWTDALFNHTKLIRDSAGVIDSKARAFQSTGNQILSEELSIVANAMRNSCDTLELENINRLEKEKIL